VIAVEVAHPRDRKAGVERLRSGGAIVSKAAVRLAEPIRDRAVAAPPQDVGLAVAVEVADPSDLHAG
jgi:hypothetical protein